MIRSEKCRIPTDLLESAMLHPSQQTEIHRPTMSLDKLVSPNFHTTNIPKTPWLLLLPTLLVVTLICTSCRKQTDPQSPPERDSDSRNPLVEFEEKDRASLVEHIKRMGGKVEFAESDSLKITLIDFSNCHSVDSATVKELGRISTLESLYLLDTKFDDEGLPYLANFPNLRNLDMKGAKISDEGLGKIPRLKELNFLGLSGTQITDTGIMRLPELSLPKLRFLQINFTNISDQAKRKLTEQLPDLKIVL